MDIAYLRQPAGAGLLALLVLIPTNTQAASVTLSFNTTTTYPNSGTFQADDLVTVDTGADTGTLYLLGDYFDNSANIDALYLRANGNVVISTAQDETFNTTPYADGDILEYNPTLGTITQLFSESLFGGADQDVDALHILGNGNILLSTEVPATLGGLSFDDSDIVEYNPGTNTATMFLQGSTFFATDTDIDGFHLLPNGDVVLSSRLGGNIGSTTFDDDDLILYSPSSGIASILFNGDHLTGTSPDINALHVHFIPLPAVFWLFFSGTIVLVLTGGRRPD